MMKQTHATTNLQMRFCAPERRRGCERRGIAMLIVLIALAVVTVSTTAFLNSRLSSPEVGENVARAIEARASAETGLDLADKIISNPNVDWRTLQVNGVLLNGYNFGGGTITIRVTDLQGNPPTATTQDIIVTAEGESNGLVQTAEAEVHAPPSNPTVDVDLSEFAVFGKHSVILDNSTITPWPLSPSFDIGKPIRIGTNNLSSLAVNTFAGTRVSNGEYFVRSGASSSTLLDTSGSPTPLRRKTISESDTIPIPKSPNPVKTGLPLATDYNPTISSGQIIVSSSEEYGKVTVKNTADIVIDTPGITFLVTNDLNLQSGGDIIINAANVDIVVLGKVSIGKYSAIELADGASLRLFVGGDMTVNKGTLGLPDTLVFDAGRDPTLGINFYQDPQRLKVYKINGTGPMTWTIKGKSYAAAMFYGRANLIVVDQSSAIFGNLVSRNVTVQNGSKVFYDPILDNGGGYTNPDSFVYDGTGNYDTNVTNNATDLDEATYAAIENYVQNVSSKDPKHSGWKKLKRRLRRIGMKTKHDEDEEHNHGNSGHGTGANHNGSGDHDGDDDG